MTDSTIARDTRVDMKELRNGRYLMVSAARTPSFPGALDSVATFAVSILLRRPVSPDAEPDTPDSCSSLSGLNLEVVAYQVEEGGETHWKITQILHQNLDSKKLERLTSRKLHEWLMIPRPRVQRRGQGDHLMQQLYEALAPVLPSGD
jgi:hypothetical protein